MSPIFHLTALHRLAAPRGDGLKQELLEMMRQGADLCDPTVGEIRGGRQAGPDPAHRRTGKLAENVLLFPLSASAMNRKP